MPKLITNYGQFWERAKIFAVKDGRLTTVWEYLNWLDDKDPPPIAQPGIYILYRGTTPVYVGMGTAKKFGIYSRLKAHAVDWLAHAWDNVSWYAFEEESAATIEAVEALLVATIPGLLNGAQPGLDPKIKCFPRKGKNDASNTLWKKAADDDKRA